MADHWSRCKPSSGRGIYYHGVLTGVIGIGNLDLVRRRCDWTDQGTLRSCWISSLLNPKCDPVHRTATATERGLAKCEYTDVFSCAALRESARFPNTIGKIVMRLSPVLTSLCLAFLVAGCADGPFWGDSPAPGGTGGGGTGGSGTGGGGTGGGGTGGGGSGTAGSLGEPTLLFAEDPGNTGFDNVALNAAGTVAVFIMSSDPLGSNPGGDDQLFSLVLGQATPVQLTSGNGAGFRNSDDFDIDSSGSQVVFVSDQDITGGNATLVPNVFIAATDGSTVTQVTALTAGAVSNPGISGDGSTIVFTSSEDLTGGNPLNDTQIFSISADGSNLAQVTMGTTAADEIVISNDGGRIAFIDSSDPFGMNADGSRELFVINTDGSNHMQLTSSAADSQTPRISDDGGYIVFASAGDLGLGENVDGQPEVYVAYGDGTGLTRITDSDSASGRPFNSSSPAVDISGNGAWITFMSYGDFVGRNNGTYTVFWANLDGSEIQQLLREETKPAGVSNRFAEVPRLSGDGSMITFNALEAYATGAPANGWKMFSQSRL